MGKQTPQDEGVKVVYEATKAVLEKIAAVRESGGGVGAAREWIGATMSDPTVLSLVLGVSAPEPPALGGGCGRLARPSKK